VTVASSAVPPNVRIQAVAVAAAFMLNGTSFGTWAARIPAIRAQTGLDEASLGFALLGASVGAVLTMIFGGWLGGRFGTHRMTPITAMGCGLLMVAIGASSSFASLTLSLLLFGVCQGTMDVSMNANGIAVEHAGRVKIISKLHASWSIGAFVGALVSSQVAALGIPVLPEFAVMGAGMVLVGIGLWFTMLPDRHSEGGGRLRLPSGPLLLLGALALCGFTAEGSASDWSGLYLQRSMAASEGVAGLAVTAFVGCMAVARLAGDRLVLLLGPARLVTGGGALAALGLSLALATQTPAVAIAGFGCMGLGLAAVVPTIFRAAGSQPGIPASVGIAAVSTMGYGGGLIGPPLIGSVASAATLRVALLIVLAMLALVVLSGRRALTARVS
jgi:predicted MFS family arabinose efflux permease